MEKVNGERVGSGGPPPGLTPALLDVRQAAAYLATTERHVRRLVNERRLAFVKLGNKLRFRPEDLDSFIERARTAAHS
jgi:excisionase family DNA binding protein